MKPIRINLRDNQKALAVELTLTGRQYRELYQYVGNQDGLNFPPRGLLNIGNAERIAQALEYAFRNTDQAGRGNIIRLRGELALANNAHEMGLRLIVTRGFELNLGFIQLGRRYEETEYITPAGETYKVPANG